MDKPRPRLVLEANITKLPKESVKEKNDDGTETSLSPSEKKNIQDDFNHQTSNVLLIQFCPIVGNLDYLRKVDKAAVQFKEDALQWTWTAAMTDHNSAIGEGLPLGYLYFLIDQLKTVGYRQVGEPEALEYPDLDGRVFEKHIYTFEQPEVTKSTKVVRM